MHPKGGSRLELVEVEATRCWALDWAEVARRRPRGLSAPAPVGEPALTVIDEPREPVGWQTLKMLERRWLEAARNRVAQQHPATAALLTPARVLQRRRT